MWEFLQKLLEPSGIRAFASIFLMGYIFRATERWLRQAPKEGEIHTVLLAVVWSLVLSVPLAFVAIDYQTWVRQDQKAPLALLSYILYAAALGCLWALARPLAFDVRDAIFVTCKKSKLLKRCLEADRDAHARSNTITKFLVRASTPERVQFRLKGEEGKTYSGYIKDWESSPHSDHTPYLVLQDVYKHGKHEDPKKLNYRWMLVSMEDMEIISIVDS